MQRGELIVETEKLESGARKAQACVWPSSCTLDHDGLGRLIGKKVYSYSGGWVLDWERRFVYDGWQMIAELGVNGSTLTRQRTAWKEIVRALLPRK